MNEYYNYSDIYLKPNYSELATRANADISVNFLGRKFKAPWCPSNMASVLNEDTAKWLSENDYFYIMHRFGDTESFVRKASQENWKTISISIGVKNEDKLLIDWFDRGVNWSELYRRKPLRIDYVTIDIAHAHSILCKEMIEFVKAKLPKSKIIAGNVCTPEAVKDLTLWGADCIKVGIAGGGACSTKNMTGFHIPMFSCVEDCSNWKDILLTKETKSEDLVRISKSKVAIIADGGIRENGDIPKALVAGATLVMAGSLFAACLDAPGETITRYYLNHYRESNNPTFAQTQLANGKTLEKVFTEKIFKHYYGSASKLNKEKTGQVSEHIEGFEVDLPCNGLTYEQKYKELTNSLKSAVSYAGGTDLSAFKDVEWVVVK